MPHLSPPVISQFLKVNVLLGKNYHNESQDSEETNAHAYSIMLKVSALDLSDLLSKRGYPSWDAVHYAFDYLAVGDSNKDIGSGPLHRPHYDEIVEFVDIIFVPKYF